MMKQVMIRAWELAKEGVAKFGGSSKEYFAASLSIAWKEQKEMAQANGKIEFPYSKKYEVQVITAFDLEWGTSSETKLKPSEIGNNIVYNGLENGIYSVSRFGGKAEYICIENGVNTDLSEEEVHEFFNGKEEVKKEGAEIRFPYAKKHWLAVIDGKDARYKLSRDFLQAKEEGNEIVYDGLEDGIYQFSRFGKKGTYLKIENGEISEIEEEVVMKMYAPTEIDKAACENDKTAREQEDQEQLDAMQPSEKLTIIKHYGYGTTSFVGFEKAPKIKKIQKLVTANRKNLLEVLEKIGATIEKDTMHESYTITKSQLGDLEAALIALEKERVAKEVAAQSVEDAKRNELITKAKETGVAQVLYSYTVECTDDKEMCDMDTVTAYIDADGIIEEIKTHNW